VTAREYLLATKSQATLTTQPVAKPRLVSCRPPPAPQPGERSPKPYGVRDLQSLYAVAHSVPWLGFATLTTPSKHRLDSWGKLEAMLKKLRSHLYFRHDKGGFPHLLAVTEFSCECVENRVRWFAHFHIVFADVLDCERSGKLRDWWKKRFPPEDWSPRCFDYKDVFNSAKIQSYVSKDTKKDWRTGNRAWVKFPCPFLPERVSTSLWFCIGIDRVGSKKGQDLMKNKSVKRVRFLSATGQSWLRNAIACADTNHPSH
jgi:hypothetical protein